MGNVRKIKQVWKSRYTVEGAGVKLKRVFGFPQVPQLDPFLLLDDFHSNDPRDYINGFPWHPHRGIETITYVLEGAVEHGDSMGNEGVIHPGEVQWMTAGSGIIHQEMPKGRNDGLLWGFQLWANLPAQYKMMDPRYRDVKNSQIQEVEVEEGVKVKIISGEVDGKKGPVKDIVTDPEYLDVDVPPGSSFSHPVHHGHTVFAYVIGGEGYFDQERDPYAFDIQATGYFNLNRDSLMDPESLIMYGEGDKLEISAGSQGVRFLLFSGKPIGEPVAWYGPIVMNTQEELRIAFREYRNGNFIKYKP